MAPLTEPERHVRVGHTEHLSVAFAAPLAVCFTVACSWQTRGEHVRRDAVDHAAGAGHLLLVAEGHTLTAIEGWSSCTRLRASDGGVCGNGERPRCTAAHLEHAEVTS